MTEPEPLRSSIEEHDDHVVLRVAGDLDVASLDEFAAAMAASLARGRVLLDLSGVAFMDSSGIRALNDVLRTVHDRGVALTVAPHLRTPVLRLLEMTGMAALLPFERPPRAEDTT